MYTQNNLKPGTDMFEICVNVKFLFRTLIPVYVNISWLWEKNMILFKTTDKVLWWCNINYKKCKRLREVAYVEQYVLKM